MSEPETTVTDGFGRRLIGTDAETRDQVELLEFSPELVEHSGFVTALADRVARFASVRHASYVRVRRLDRPDADRLQLVSDFTAGWRLYEMLDESAASNVKVDITVVIGLVRQLLPALALFSRHNRDNAVGTLSPQRLIVTPQGRLVIAECVFGPAIEKLNLDRDTLWRDFRIAMPSSEGPARANPRADAYAVGVVALSLLLGRVLDPEEFPGDLEGLVASAQEYRGGDASPLSAAFVTWLQRALQLDAERAFQTPSEMQLEFEKVLASDRSYVTTGTALSEWVFRVGTKIDNRRRPVPPPPAPEPAYARPETSALLRAPEPEVKTEPEAEPESVPDTEPESEPEQVVQVAAPERDPEPEAEPEPRESWIPAQPAMYREPAHLVNREPDPEPAPSPAYAREPEPEPVDARVPEPEPVVAAEPAPPLVYSPEPEPSSPYGREPETPSVYSPPPAYTPVEEPAPSTYQEFVHAREEAGEPVANEPTPAYDAEPETLEAPAAEYSQTPLSSQAADEPQLPEAFETPQALEAPRTSRSPLVYGLAAVVVLLIAVVGWLTTRGGSGVGAGEGQLVVTSRPEGAEVTIDGEGRGKTPLTVSLNAGAHVMEVQSGKSEPRVIPFTITAGVQTAQYVELQGVVSTGSLEIRSEPSGARITIDGQNRGTTPMTVSNLRPGDHTIVLELKGRKATQVVRIEAGTAAKLSVPIR